MNLVIDYGNSRIKAGTFVRDEAQNVYVFSSPDELAAQLRETIFDHVLISSVRDQGSDLLMAFQVQGLKIMLSSNTPLPIMVKYATPETLGVDRLAAACGAHAHYPDRDCLVIDMGTCINYEFVDASGNYLGGAISPGVKMRFDAMNRFTARLPLLSPSTSAELIGQSTEACMQSGVLNGVQGEIESIIRRYREIYPGVGVILCGGDAFLFENKGKDPIFVAPNLVLSGLNSILLHNVHHKK